MLWVWLMIGTIIVILLVILFLVTFVEIKIYALQKKKKDKLFIETRFFFGIIHFKFDVSLAKITRLFNKEQTSQQKKVKITKKSTGNGNIGMKVKWFLSQVPVYKDWMYAALSHVRLREFRWVSQLGMDDAVTTATAIGVYWTIKTTMFSYISHHVNVQTKPKIQIQPVYNRTHFSTEFLCIGKIRLGYAIIAGIFLVFRIRKSKGGMRAWQNIQSKA